MCANGTGVRDGHECLLHNFKLPPTPRRLLPPRAAVEAARGEQPGRFKLPLTPRRLLPPRAAVEAARGVRPGRFKLPPTPRRLLLPRAAVEAARDSDLEANASAHRKCELHITVRPLFRCDAQRITVERLIGGLLKLPPSPSQDVTTVCFSTFVPRTDLILVVNLTFTAANLKHELEGCLVKSESGVRALSCTGHQLEVWNPT
jgi:hypothetical protein